MAYPSSVWMKRRLNAVAARSGWGYYQAPEEWAVSLASAERLYQLERMTGLPRYVVLSAAIDLASRTLTPGVLQRHWIQYREILGHRPRFPRIPRKVDRLVPRPPRRLTRPATMS